ncbi:MAG TPA: hypothetical protein VL588_03055 [Bdellovibrionota bacterium]|jgi:hypothetical protein|nr:hypothetical protein [Bdellovibrionota bacterium]
MTKKKPSSATLTKKSAPAKAVPSPSPKAAKGAKPPVAAASKKAEKGAKPAPEAEVASSEMEEGDEDADMAVGSSGGDASAAMSLAGPGPGQMDTSSGGMKTFRHHPEIENFYRFIYENDLRFEALGIMDEYMNEKRARKAIKAVKSKVH